MQSQNYFQICQIYMHSQSNSYVHDWCLAKVAAQSSGWAELDELGPGTGDKGVQKCVIAWLCWRLLEANWCFSDFVCDTSAFTPSVPNLRVLLQKVHCTSNSWLGTAFNQLNSGCSSLHLLNLHFPTVVAEDFPFCWTSMDPCLLYASFYCMF